MEVLNFELTRYATLDEFFRVVISPVPVLVSFAVNAILKILSCLEYNTGSDGRLQRLSKDE